MNSKDIAYTSWTLWADYYKDGNKSSREILDILTADIEASKSSLEKVTRVEVIDEKGRTYVNWKPDNKVEISLQDDNKTLKVFISKVPEHV